MNYRTTSLYKTKKLSALIYACCLFFAHPLQAQEFSIEIESQIEKFLQNETESSQNIEWKINSEHISSTSNIHHIYFIQTYNGIEVYNTNSSIHIQDKENVVTSNNNFVKNISEKINGSISNNISAIEAIQIISRNNNYSLTYPLKIINNKEKVNGSTLISNGGISLNDISAKLVYVKDNNDDFKIAWQLNILELDRTHWWDYFVDANSGATIFKIDNVFSCSSENKKNDFKRINAKTNLKESINTNSLNCENCYEVLPMPLESPYYGERSIVTDPANYFASPLGWHNDANITQNDYLVTKGNNINAFIGNEDNYEYQPNGGNNLNFTNYQFNQDFTESSRNENASITNLFYWGNIIHDVLYQYGFDEHSGNFQTHNFDKGGNENDMLTILGQEDLNLCNASIGISKDGVQPFIKLNVCGDKDGAYDNTVLIHEYIHGLSFRLTGGADSDNCLTNVERMTEGWADWYALMLTMSPNDISTDPRGIATYLFNQGENGEGVRDYPYTTDMNINPQTYSYIAFDQGTHQVGSVWAAMLWELTWALIEDFGFDENIYNFTGDLESDAGNVIALAIVTEAMKLQGCEPGFVDGRNAILVAFQSIYGSGNNCLIWEPFAKRGLGYFAVQGNSDDLSDGFESYEMPSMYADFDKEYDNICINSEMVYGLTGGFPLGGIYSGPGVIDDGNGVTFKFIPSEVGIGVHEISYEINDSLCTIASVDTNNIEVIADEVSPEITCYNDLVVTIPEGEFFYSIPNFNYNVTIYDNCFSNPIITQNPLNGANVGIGETLVTMTARDDGGYETTCSFNLIVKGIAGSEEIIENVFEVYPNPTTGELIIYSNEEIEVLTVGVFDINGRLIKTKTFNDFGFAKSISIEDIETGLYFLKFDSKDINTIKRILKE